MSIDRSKRIHFEEHAALYAETRPGYPDALIEDVLTLAGIAEDTDSARILEIGCGPGNATLSFAHRGYAMLCIELGQQLAEIARERCREFPQVTILNVEFEDWQVEENAFDLAIAADALHWIPPEVAYPAVARALKDGGSAALWWTVPVMAESPLFDAIAAVYQEVAPGVDDPEQRFNAEWLVGVITGNFEQFGQFGDVAVRRHAVAHKMTTQQYIKSLRTYSSHRGLDDDTRARLYAGIGEAIDRFGGSITLSEELVLFHAKVKRTS